VHGTFLEGRWLGLRISSAAGDPDACPAGDSITSTRKSPGLRAWPDSQLKNAHATRPDMPALAARSAIQHTNASGATMRLRCDRFVFSWVINAHKGNTSLRRDLRHKLTVLTE
jgi:hypothetical protein